MRYMGFFCLFFCQFYLCQEQRWSLHLQNQGHQAVHNSMLKTGDHALMSCFCCILHEQAATHTYVQ